MIHKHGIFKKRTICNAGRDEEICAQKYVLQNFKNMYSKEFMKFLNTFLFVRNIKQITKFLSCLQRKRVYCLCSLKKCNNIFSVYKTLVKAFQNHLKLLQKDMNKKQNFRLDFSEGMMMKLQFSIKQKNIYELEN